MNTEVQSTPEDSQENNIVIFHSNSLEHKATAAYVLWCYRKLLGLPRDNVMLYSVPSSQAGYVLPFDVATIKDQMFYFVGCEVHPAISNATSHIVSVYEPHSLYGYFTNEKYHLEHKFPPILNSLSFDTRGKYLITDQQMELFKPNMDDVKLNSDSQWDRIRTEIRRSANDGGDTAQNNDNVAVTRDNAVKMMTAVTEYYSTLDEEAQTRIQSYPWYASYLKIQHMFENSDKINLGGIQALHLLCQIFTTDAEMWYSDSDLAQMEKYKDGLKAGASIYNTDVDHVQFWFTLFDEVQPAIPEATPVADVVPTEEPAATDTPVEADTTEATLIEAEAEAEEVKEEPASTLHIPTMDEVNKQQKAEEQSMTDPSKPVLYLKANADYDKNDVMTSDSKMILVNTSGNMLDLSGIDITGGEGTCELYGMMLATLWYMITEVENGERVVKQTVGYAAADHRCAFMEQDDKDVAVICFDKPIRLTKTEGDSIIVLNNDFKLTYNKKTHDFSSEQGETDWFGNTDNERNVLLVGFTLDNVVCKNPFFKEPEHKHDHDHSVTNIQATANPTTSAIADTTESTAEPVAASEPKIVEPDLTDPTLLINQVYQAGCAITEYTAIKERYIARTCAFPVQLNVADGVVITLMALNTPPARPEIVTPIIEDAYDGYVMFEQLNRQLIVLELDLVVATDVLEDTETYLNALAVPDSIKLTVKPVIDTNNDRITGTILVTRETWNQVLDESNIDKSGVVIPQK